MPSLRRPLLACLLLPGLVLSACTRTAQLDGSDDFTSATIAVSQSNEGPESGGDACTLIRLQEIAATIGGDVRGPARLDEEPTVGPPILPGMKMCRFLTSTDDDAEPAVVAFGLLVRPAARQLDHYRDVNGRFGLEAVPDLGTEALWDGDVGTLLVSERQDLLGFTLSVPGDPVEDVRERAVWLARRALSRL